MRTLKDKFEFWTQQQPALNFVAIVLEWFSITVEVFLRRDFGERYFNRSKVMSGFFVLTFWSFVRKMGSNFNRPSMVFFSGAEPPPEPSLFSFGGLVFTIIILLYLVLCGYHSFSIWWRNATNRPLHSWDAGKSWLIPIGLLFMIAANKLVGIFCRIFAFTLPPAEREKLLQSPPTAMDDPTLFTERYIEPLTVFTLSFVCMTFGAGALGSWLLFSTVGLMFWTNIRHEKEREEMLDMRDSLIKSRYMTEAIIHGETDGLRIKSNVKKIVEQMAVQAAATPETMEQFREGAPSLANAMEALNPKLRNLAANTPSEEVLVKEITVVKEEPPPTPPPTKEERPPVLSMSLRQPEFFVKETIVIKEEPPQPVPVPPPAFTAKEEHPPVAPEQQRIQNPERPPKGAPADAKKMLKTLLVIAGLAIVSLVVFLIVTSKKSDTPVENMEVTETPTLSPPPSVSASPSPPSSPQKLKGQIQTENGGIVNMRDQPSENGEILLSIPTGDEVAIMRYGNDTVLSNGEQGRWCRIVYKTHPGWVWGKYVKEKE